MRSNENKREDRKISNSFSCVRKVLQEKSVPEKKVLDYTNKNHKALKYLFEYTKKSDLKRNPEASSTLLTANNFDGLA